MRLGALHSWTDALWQGCGDVSDQDIRIVVGPDGRPTGEGYVEIKGPNANLRLALAKDRQIMPVCAAAAFIPPRSRLLADCMLSCAGGCPVLLPLKLTYQVVQPRALLGHGFSNQHVAWCRTRAGMWRCSAATGRRLSAAS